MLVPADRGRVTRSSSQLQYGYEPDSFGALIKSRYALYAKLLDAILDALKRRFEPWPKWLVKCNVAFNFSDDFSNKERETAFGDLLDCPFGPTPLSSEEKDRLSAEFITMCLNASAIACELSERLKIKDHALAHSVWFELLTNEQYYKSCQKVNNFALRFLNRSLNEAVVEVEVSNLKETSSDKRKLLQKNTEMLNFVSTNGPHPLVCMDVVDCFLTRHFGKNWHFTISSNKYFVSKVVDRHVRSAQELPNSLA